MAFEEQIKAHCGRFPIEQIRVARFDELEVTEINGAVFVFAVWSGPSVAAFRYLCSALATGLHGKSLKEFSIYVLDADRLDPGRFESKFGEIPHGWGEAYWVKNGTLIYSDRGYKKETDDLLIQRVGEFS